MEKVSDGIVESDALAIDSVARMIGHPSQQLSRVLVLFGVTTARFSSYRNVKGSSVIRHCGKGHIKRPPSLFIISSLLPPW